MRVPDRGTVYAGSSGVASKFIVFRYPIRAGLRRNIISMIKRLGGEPIRRARAIAANEGVEFIGGKRGGVVVALPDRAGPTQEKIGLL
ncbi:MAG: hypothetical protein RIR33_2173, partial [Pseudomonadota bacterium]